MKISECNHEMFNLANKLATLSLDCNGILLELLYHLIRFLLLFYVEKLLRFGQRG